VQRGGEQQALDDDLRPGDVLLLPDDVPLLRGGVIDRDGTEQASDVYEDPSSATLRLGAGSRLDPATRAPAVRNVLERLFKQAKQVQAWTVADKRGLASHLDELAAVLAHDPMTEFVRHAAQLLRGAKARDAEAIVLEVDLARDDDTELVPHMVIADRRRIIADEDLRQTWTPNEAAVPLQTHQAAVAERARVCSETLGLAPDLVRALELAGLHHDDGKLDERFQRLLGAQTNQEPLAKSARRSLQDQRRAEQQAQLPPRWRHEQLSAVLVHVALLDEPDRDLAVRLVGTTHGHGRTGFPHGAVDLLPARHEHAGVAQELFDLGDWDALVETTDLRYGVWGCAYLEAVLRAADGRVSGEGS